MRTLSEISLRALKAATAAAFDLAGGVTLLSQLLRMGIPTLSKYASFNEEHGDNFIRVDLAVEADRRAGSPVITAAMARELGYRLVREERVGGSPLEFCHRTALRLNADLVDVIREITAALDDLKIDAGERKRILKEINEAIRALEQARDQLTGV
ncbi:hypothetical protein DEM27_00055 [Metarhizobium album]|uniref:Uncharacterized protein n=1 Tax=Metarhizobium album TaxID=2182425 RepID=A0A2U2DWE9_9HYPH|nr:phage regulatory CII family protein [Rhizobium album]PWE57644.1 hypothetical protein DEM27_00055 [Rhizobium album]